MFKYSLFRYAGGFLILLLIKYAYLGVLLGFFVAFLASDSLVGVLYLIPVIVLSNPLDAVIRDILAKRFPLFKEMKDKDLYEKLYDPSSNQYFNSIKCAKFS